VHQKRVFLFRYLPFLIFLLALGPSAVLGEEPSSSLGNQCLNSLKKVFASRSFRVIPAGQPESTPIRTSQDLEASLAPYFLMDDPQGWEKHIRKAVSSSYLNGNGGGAERIVLPDGIQIVTKSFRLNRSKLDQARQIVDQMKEWERTGEGVALRGVSLNQNPKTGETAFKVFMEDVTSPQNSVGNLRISGEGTELSQLRKYSPPAREWVANRMIELLDKHPDPHARNIFFRVSELSSFGNLPPESSYYREGNLIFQVLLIDATGGKGMPDHPMRIGNPQFVPSMLRQYNRQSQIQYFRKQLGLY